MMSASEDSTNPNFNQRHCDGSTFLSNFNKRHCDGATFVSYESEKSEKWKTMIQVTKEWV